jgi:hypothetical protein
LSAAAIKSCAVSASDVEGGSASSNVSVDIVRGQGRTATMGRISWGIANNMTLRYGGNNNKIQIYWQVKRDGSWLNAFTNPSWSAHDLGNSSGSAYSGRTLSWPATVTAVRLRVRTSWDTFGADPSKTCYLAVAGS